MRSIADHALHDYRDFETSPDAASCAYTPRPTMRVASSTPVPTGRFFSRRRRIDFGDRPYQRRRSANLNFVLESQNADGSWFYSPMAQRDFVDHFHTCFVLKALAKIEALTGDSRVHRRDRAGCPLLRRQSVRRTAAAEAVLARAAADRVPSGAVRLRRMHQPGSRCCGGRFPELDADAAESSSDVLDRWRKPDGSFRSRAAAARLGQRADAPVGPGPVVPKSCFSAHATPGLSAS